MGEFLEEARAFLGLGANLGDRAANIRQAIALLGQTPGIRVVRTAALLESDALTLEGENLPMPRFLNTVCEIATALLPRELLFVCQSIEAALGRQRHSETRRRQPRPIDIDILLYGHEVIAEPGLAIPHPEMHRRQFVLEPFCEIAPYVIHPAFGISMRGLRDRLEES
ncbi:MAG: 2-amino-4-hydroxy-6-hydroxymethyldihydropteridine diphosphokinase, partial [Planctomycetota bacterium]|nr:2-amino-4-hydroxy-6-hydroxymethyldihydropteridine diphosphokinase [Planctomycetota bacterium]